MDKMFDLLFCYGVSSFLHTNTSSRLIFRVRLSELPVQLAVLRGRLITSWVHLIILSARFVSWPLWFIVLRVWLITDHIGSSFHHGILSFHYSATETKFSYLRFLHNNKVWTLQALLSFFGPMECRKLCFSPLNLASRAQNWWPSWHGQNSLVTSLVVYISELWGNPKWAWSVVKMLRSPKKVFGQVLCCWWAREC